MSDHNLTGPWKACFNVPTATIPGHIIKVDDDVQLPIASIWEGGGKNGKSFYVQVALLISAAPCLLKALKTALPVLDDAEQDARAKAKDANTQAQNSGPHASGEYRKIEARWTHVADCFKADADAARAAIAKAEGPQPRGSKRKPSTKNKAA